MTENIIGETIGCDLGDKKSEIRVFAASGEMVQRASVRTTPEAMRAFFKRPPAHVVIEVGGQSRWVGELLVQMGHRVTVANPRRVRLISQNDDKDDPVDAELLGRLGRVDVKLLAPVKHRSSKAQMDLAVPKARDLLVGMRTKLVNHVRSTVKLVGERLPACSSESFGRKTRGLLPTALKAALEPMYEVLERIDEQIREQDKMIERLGKRYPDVAVVSQISGVGTLTALVFVLSVEDKQRFRSSRMLGAYFGLRPRRRKSGESDPQLRITKAGDPFVRRLLVNAANHVLGPFGRRERCEAMGVRTGESGGKNAKKRAKVAVARKLAVLMHRLWVTGEVYQATGYQQHQTEDKAVA
jgi:transposase